MAYAATLTLFVLANRLTTAANTIYLQSTAPLYLALLAPWLLHEPTRKKDLLFMAAVGLGLALFFVGVEQPAETAPDPVRGNMLALASGVFWALTVCGLRWMGSAGGERNSATVAVVAGNVIAFLIALPLALPLGSHTAGDWALIGYLAVFQIALAYVLSQPFPTFALIGPRQLSETRTSLPALDVTLSPDELAWLNLERDEKP